MQRVWKIVLLVLTVVVIAGAAYVLKQRDPVPQAGTTPGYADAPSSAAPSTSARGTQSAQPVKVVFLGDDYTAGIGATSAAHSWTAVVARRLPIDATVVAEANAGYAKPGAHGSTYLDLVPAVVAAHPQVVVVSGGRNDVADAPATLRAQAKALFAKLKAKLPDARLLAVAPWWGDSVHPAELKPVDAAVRAGVEAAGGTYLDLPDPLLNHSGWMADAADPNNRGYGAIGKSMAEALRSELPR